MELPQSAGSYIQHQHAPLLSVFRPQRAHPPPLSLVRLSSDEHEIFDLLSVWRRTKRRRRQNANLEGRTVPHKRRNLARPAEAVPVLGVDITQLPAGVFHASA